MPKKSPGIRCAECGAWLDPGERCDCEKIKAEMAFLKRLSIGRKNATRNRKMMEQAQLEFDYR